MSKGKGPFGSHVATGQFGEVLAHPSKPLKGLAYMSLFPTVLVGGKAASVRAIIVGTPNDTAQQPGNEIGMIVTIGTQGWVIDDG